VLVIDSKLHFESFDVRIPALNGFYNAFKTHVYKYFKGLFGLLNYFKSSLCHCMEPLHFQSRPNSLTYRTTQYFKTTNWRPIFTYLKVTKIITILFNSEFVGPIRHQIFWWSIG